LAFPWGMQKDVYACEMELITSTNHHCKPEERPVKISVQQRKYILPRTVKLNKWWNIYDNIHTILLIILLEPA
jgi:hypothetical protein